MGLPGFEHDYAFPRGLSVGIISRMPRRFEEECHLLQSCRAKFKGRMDCTQSVTGLSGRLVGEDASSH